MFHRAKSNGIIVFCYAKSFMTFFLTVGATLACGTGACAVVVAAVLEGHAERVSLTWK